MRDEIQKIMGFWLQLGVSGFRMDAVPFLIEKKGAGVEPDLDFDFLNDMRDFLQWRSRRRRSCWPKRTCRRRRA